MRPNMLQLQALDADWLSTHFNTCYLPLIKGALTCSKCRHYIQPAPAAKKRSLLPLLLLLTELAYIATYLTSMGLNGWAFEDLKLNPMAGGSASTLTTLGAVGYDEIVYHHQWWRFLAAPFVCSGECF